MPDFLADCIKTWKKYCPDYEIICWNEDKAPYITILLFSVPGVDAAVPLPLFDVYKKELRIVGSMTRTPLIRPELCDYIS